MNYLTKYEELRTETNMVDYSLSYNRDSALSDVYDTISNQDIFECINKYPEVEYGELKQIIRSMFNINNVIVGSGSEDLIFKINRGLLKDKRVGVVVPTFYRIYESLESKPIIIKADMLTDGVYFSKKKIIEKIKSFDMDAIWITNPNSIYGHAIKAQDLVEIIGEFSNILFIVDEVSLDFIIGSHNFEMIRYAEKFSNLVVVKSFSKYYGIPGLRLGILSTNNEMMKKIDDMASVYPVNNISLPFCKVIADNQELFNELKYKIAENINQIKVLLEDTPIHVLDSLTNTLFLWIKDESINLWKLLSDYGIITYSLREEKFVPYRNSVRITIHSGEDFEQLYKLLEIMIKEEFYGD